MDMTALSRLILMWRGVSFVSFVNQHGYDGIPKVRTYAEFIFIDVFIAMTEGKVPKTSLNTSVVSSSVLSASSDMTASSS